MDFGRSDDPRVQAQLDRLSQLSVPQGRLGLETIRALMERLGNPHRKLPPVFHVAGTNGKGSVCAFLRAMLEADGKRVHVTTSPHLVRYNERIRLAGKLIEDGPLAELLGEVLDAGEDMAPSFFEVTIAAAFLAFSRTPADACVVEVGLGGRFDATNVLEPEVLAACGIAALGIDHERFLLAPEKGVPTEPMARIAFEKAGIAKQGVPLVTLAESHTDATATTISRVAEDVGAKLLSAGRPSYDLASMITLPGPHQCMNAALAIAMLKNQELLNVSPETIEAGLRTAYWPARMQRLAPGPLTGSRAVWLDGGHNANAGKAMAEALQGPLHLILAMLDNKDPLALVSPLGDRILSLQVVPVANRESHPACAFGKNAVARTGLRDAVRNAPNDNHPILIAGSLYLAGEALRLNDEIPD